MDTDVALPSRRAAPADQGPPGPSRPEQGPPDPSRPEQGDARQGHEGPQDPTGVEAPGLIVLLVPPVLALISIGLGWVLVGSLTELSRMIWASGVMLVLIALRLPMERTVARHGPGRAPVVALYTGHVLLLVIAVVLNPLACIYAFTGYLDVFRFTTGRVSQVLVLVTALLMAIGQTGGVDRVLDLPLLFLGLGVVNIFLALTMSYVTSAREKEMDERERTLLALEQATRERDALEGELLRQARETGISDERARLSREIHDTVAQGLVGVIRQLETVGGDLDAGTAEEARRRVDVAEEAARDCLIEARRAVEALAPQQLTDVSTADGLGELVARWARTHRIVATFDADDAPCHGSHAAVLIRIAQEALANVSRHSGASTVTVTLSGSDAEQSLQVTDDGRGFDAETVSRGHGLDNMDQRVRAVGGRLHVSSHEDAGTTVIATVPR